MDIGGTTVSLGGAAVGTGILAVTLQRWWMKGGGGGKGKGGEGGGGGALRGRKITALIPYTVAGLYGVLIVLCAGGLLGSAGHLVLWGGNAVGDAALVYGVGGQTHDTTNARLVPLTDGGYVVVLVATLLVVGAFKWSKKLPKLQVAMGATTGICLGLNAGVAGALAVPLASFANMAGAWWAGVVQ